MLVSANLQLFFFGALLYRYLVRPFVPVYYCLYTHYHEVETLTRRSFNSESCNRPELIAVADKSDHLHRQLNHDAIPREHPLGSYSYSYGETSIERKPEL